jgi:hypothetical protein
MTTTDQEVDFMPPRHLHLVPDLEVEEDPRTWPDQLWDIGKWMMAGGWLRRG